MKSFGLSATVDYGYDPTSQLTSADYSDPSLADESYSFDLVGNRTMTGYQTGTGNRLLSDGTYSYEYDDEGNRTKRTKTSTGEVTEYEWDFRNRLTKVTEKDSSGNVTKVVEYTYDVFNRRIAKEVDTASPFDMQDAAIERYVYDDINNGMASLDGGNVVLDFEDADGPGGSGAMTLSKRYLWGERVDELLAQEDVTKSMSATDRVLWPIVDHLGTVRDLVKQDGTAATHFVYTAFGGIVSGDTSLTRYLFTSREFDADTGLQYNRARWYDAKTGRWISEDPLGFAAGDVGNGVVAWVDKRGLRRSWFGWIGSGVRRYGLLLTHPWEMDRDLEVAYYVSVGTAAAAGAAARGFYFAGVNPVLWGSGSVAAGIGISSQAVVQPGLSAGTYPALLGNGTVYVARFHSIAWEMAGKRQIKSTVWLSSMRRGAYSNGSRYVLYV